jgi:hypothetical protein
MTLKEKVMACVAANVPHKYRNILLSKLEDIFASTEKYRINSSEIIKINDKENVESHRVLTEKDSSIGDDAYNKSVNKKTSK